MTRWKHFAAVALSVVVGACLGAPIGYGISQIVRAVFS